MSDSETSDDEVEVGRWDLEGSVIAKKRKIGADEGGKVGILGDLMKGLDVADPVPAVEQ
jgi:hypothetical protein